MLYVLLSSEAWTLDIETNSTCYTPLSDMHSGDERLKLIATELVSHRILVEHNGVLPRIRFPRRAGIPAAVFLEQVRTPSTKLGLGMTSLSTWGFGRPELVTRKLVSSFDFYEFGWVVPHACFYMLLVDS